MARPRARIGSYRLHKASGQAITTIKGKIYYLGPDGSPRSRAEYDRLVDETTSRARRQARQPPPRTDLTVAELCVEFVEHATTYYTKNGKPTSEIHSVRRAVQTLRQLYAHTRVDAFGPLALKSCRDRWVADGLTRGGVNRLARIVKTVFRWGVENELVPAEVWQALTAVGGLKRGRTPAGETQPVRPVPDELLLPTLEAAQPMVRAMIRVQLLTGMRPGELLQMRGTDFDTSATVWAYRPNSHKLEHQGHERIVFLGPEAQAELTPSLRAAPDECLFGPKQLREFDLRHRTGPTAPHRIGAADPQASTPARPVLEERLHPGDPSRLGPGEGRALGTQPAPSQRRDDAAGPLRHRGRQGHPRPHEHPDDPDLCRGRPTADGLHHGGGGVMNRDKKPGPQGRSFRPGSLATPKRFDATQTSGGPTASACLTDRSRSTA